MNVFPFFPFISAALVLFLGCIVYWKNQSNRVNLNFFVMCFFIFIWQFFYALAFNQNVAHKAILLLKLGYSGVIFIPPAFYCFVVTFLSKKYSKKIIVLSYFMSCVFFVLLWCSDLFLNGVVKFFWGYYPQAAYTHPFFILFLVSLISVSIFLLFMETLKRTNKVLNLQRLKYVTWALSIGPLGSIDFLANYGLNIYPVGWLFIDAYISIVAYAIVRYRLMDITLVVTRTSIFIAVYSIVLGIPFAFAFGVRAFFVEILGDSWWLGPLVMSTILATAGPFIYLFIQKQAEEKLFQEQRRYQNTLRQASSGMGRIKDLDRLVNLIVHIITRTVHIEHALIYLSNPQTGRYCLKASRSKDVRFNFIPEVDSISPVIKHLMDTRNPIVYDEVKQQTEDYGELSLARLENALKALSAALVVPSFVEDRLLAIIVLGKKDSGVLYTEDDFNVFSILANQAALAIENAQFYEDMKLTHEQLFKAEKMATIGTMADGLSHQINNRLHALGFIASDVLDTIKLKKDLPMSAEFKEMLVDIEHGLTRIQENVTQGGEIVRGLLKYTRKGEEGFAAVDLNQLLDSAIEMTQFKIKSGEMNILREFGPDIPKIKGNFTQLQEVFFNLIDNAYDAMMQRKTELKEPGYEPTIRVSTESSNNGHLVISVHDNGIGIKGDDKNKLFTPFFTTKLSSKKGTGLGLYVIRKLIEENHGGKVVYDSKYQEGTRVTLDLPIFTAT